MTRKRLKVDGPVMCARGSTTPCCHLIAMARACEVPLAIDTFHRSATGSRLFRLKPSGKFVMDDLTTSGTPAVPNTSSKKACSMLVT